MKFILTMIMCTSVYNMCLDPFPMPTKYSSHYECMIAGYEESIKKAKEILSWTPETSFVDGIKKTIEKFKLHKFLNTFCNSFSFFGKKP